MWRYVLRYLKVRILQSSRYMFSNMIFSIWCIIFMYLIHIGNKIIIFTWISEKVFRIVDCWRRLLSPSQPSVLDMYVLVFPSQKNCSFFCSKEGNHKKTSILKQLPSIPKNLLPFCWRSMMLHSTAMVLSPPFNQKRFFMSALAYLKLELRGLSVGQFWDTCSRRLTIINFFTDIWSK